MTRFHSEERGLSAVSDSAFWDFIYNDPTFRARFHCRVHPLQECNGGVAFHNPDNLRKLLQQAQHDYETMPKVGMSAWARKNRMGVLRDWLTQVQWLIDHAR